MRFDVAARSVFNGRPTGDVFSRYGDRGRRRVLLFFGYLLVDRRDRFTWLRNPPFAAFHDGLEEIDVTGGYGFPVAFALHPFAGAVAQAAGDFGAVDEKIHVLEQVI